MASGKKSETTGLTEAQARALADWWGGSYQKYAGPGGSGDTCHGVILYRFCKPDPAMQGTRETIIFSLEEARALEKFRDVNNPGAIDWVG